MTVSLYEQAVQTLRNRYLLNLTSVRREDSVVKVRGWLTPPSGGRGLVVDGADIVQTSYPLRRSGVGELFQAAEFEWSGLEASLSSKGGSKEWPGYILVHPKLPPELRELEIVNTWAIPVADGEFVLPPEDNITRVTGSQTGSVYLLGGATHAYRLAKAAELVSGSALASFESVADWGCGAARLSQHFLRFWPNTVGVEVDATNIAWCREAIPGMRVVQIPWTPSGPVASAHFDLLFAFSVFSHIHHLKLPAWIEEIHRVLRPGGVAVITTLGLVSTASRHARAEFYEELEAKGFVEWANKKQLDDVRPTEDDYLNIAMTKEYARGVFGRSFDVLGVVEGLGPQDAWVLRK